MAIKLIGTQKKANKRVRLTVKDTPNFSKQPLKTVRLTAKDIHNLSKQPLNMRGMLLTKDTCWQQTVIQCNCSIFNARMA
jgi:hypothetical protein